MRHMLLAAVMLLAVAGCTRYWAKPGGTDAEWAATEDRCETDALHRFPLAPVGLGYYAPWGSQCTIGPTGPACVTYSGTESDLNGQSRSGAFRACLIDAGWLPARDRDDAAAISRLRHAPAPSPAEIQEARAWCDKMFNERRNAAVMDVFHNRLDECVATHSRDFD